MGVSSPLGSLTSIGLSSFIGSPFQIGHSSRSSGTVGPRRPRLAVYNKIGEPVSDLFVGGYTVITGSESLECAVSHALSVQDVAEGGHR